MLGDSTWQSDATCGTTPYSGAVEVKFDFKGDKDCIYAINMGDVIFKDKSGNQFQATSHTQSLLATQSSVAITGNQVTYIFCFQLASQADWDKLGCIHLNWHIQNEIGDWSNTLCAEVCKFGTCKIYEVVETVATTDNVITFTVRDNAGEDGDRVTICMNGVTLASNMTITNAGATYTLPLKVGQNLLNVYAHNQASGLNTCEIAFHGHRTIELHMRKLRGKSIDVNKR